MAFVEPPTKKKRIFAPLKSDKEVKNARTEGISPKTASDTKYCLGMWEAWVNYRKKENNNTIGTIESLITTTLQYWLSRFMLEVAKYYIYIFFIKVTSNIFCVYFVFVFRFTREMGQNFHPTVYTISFVA